MSITLQILHYFSTYISAYHQRVGCTNVRYLTKAPLRYGAAVNKRTIILDTAAASREEIHFTRCGILAKWEALTQP